MVLADDVVEGARAHAVGKGLVRNGFLIGIACVVFQFGALGVGEQSEKPAISPQASCGCCSRLSRDLPGRMLLSGMPLSMVNCVFWPLAKLSINSLAASMQM